MPSRHWFRRNRRYALAGTAFVAIAGAVVAFIASPASSTQARAPKILPELLSQVGNVVSAVAAPDQAEQQRITKYWTPNRMEHAVDRDRFSLTGSNTHSLAGLADTKDPVAERRSATSSVWTGGGKVARTVGKVFFTSKGTDFLCSGTVVTSANKSTVVTAGHCVNEGPGSFARNWVFVPGYHDGERPYGTWTANRLITTASWQRSGEVDGDAGFAVVNKLDGKNIGNVVGSQNIAFNQPRGAKLYAFGFPTVTPFDGEELYYCSGMVGSDKLGDTSSQSMGCDMTEGASGGPWFENFDPATGVGTVESVTSFGYSEDPEHLYGTFFGTEIQDAYRQAEKLSNAE